MAVSPAPKPTAAGSRKSPVKKPRGAKEKLAKAESVDKIDTSYLQTLMGLSLIHI